jgi:hypothetical protein
VFLYILVVLAFEGEVMCLSVAALLLLGSIAVSQERYDESLHFYERAYDSLAMVSPESEQTAVGKQ